MVNRVFNLDDDEPDVVVLALKKRHDTYIFLYRDDPQTRLEVVRRLGRFAADPELSFSWKDAHAIGAKVEFGK